jgi:hypothetical protein
VSFSQSIPDEEDLRSFLLTFRQLMSPKEPVFLRSVAGLLWQAVDDPTNREILAAARTKYDHALRHGTVRFEHNGTLRRCVVRGCGALGITQWVRLCRLARIAVNKRKTDYRARSGRSVHKLLTERHLLVHHDGWVGQYRVPK